MKAEKTELDAHFENLLQRADKTEEHTKRLLSALESYLQPNPSNPYTFYMNVIADVIFLFIPAKRNSG